MTTSSQRLGAHYPPIHDVYTGTLTPTHTDTLAGIRSHAARCALESRLHFHIYVSLDSATAVKSSSFTLSTHTRIQTHLTMCVFICLYANTLAHMPSTIIGSAT